jgi:hypothetical protein
MKPETVFQALKRYNKRGEFIDNRINNGRNNPRQKIGDELRRRLLDRNLLQQWSGYNLEQRCILIEQDFGVKLS